MTRDDNKGIDNILYNHLNLAVEIIFATGNKIEYLYNAVGQKVRKTVTKNAVGTVTDYLEGFQYTDAKLSFFPHAEGYVKVTLCEECQQQYQVRFNYVYNYTDHLGNIRLSYGIDPKDEILKIMEENHYYPFGLKHTNYNGSKLILVKDEEEIMHSKLKQLPGGEQVEYKYKLNGMEWQDELSLNLYDYGARNYDPAIGRWMNMDPLAELSRRWSPYNYAYNNPIVFIDPDGMLAQSFLDDLWNKSGSGETKWTNNDNGTFSGSNGETVSTGEEEDQKSKSITPVNEKNKKNISKVSWGETQGLYPVKTEKDKKGKTIKPKNKDLYDPSTWDADLLKQLLKARSAINLLASRNGKHHTDSPNLDDPIEKMLAAYHLTDNFPEVDTEIKDDAAVQYFYLSADANAKTPSISSKYWNQEKVKTYGPFYNTGGGDAPAGLIYLHFYKAVKK